MAEAKLQELIDALKRQGVEEGEESGRRIVESAQKEAEEITAQARAEAEEIVARAKAEAEQQLKRLQSALEIAASQFVNNLKGIIAENFLTLPLGQKIKADLSEPDFLKTIMAKFVESYAANHQNRDIKLILPQEVQPEVLNYTYDLMAKHFGSGREHVSVGLESQGVKFGFQVDKESGNVRLDFTSEAFLDLFLRFLSPRFRDLFKTVKVG